MSKIKIDDRVIVNSPYIGKSYGTIEAIHDSPRFDIRYIVKLDNGTLIKCLPHHLTLVENDNEVTLTRERFAELVQKATNPENFREDYEDDTPLFISQCGGIVCDILTELIFKND